MQRESCHPISGGQDGIIHALVRESEDQKQYGEAILNFTIAFFVGTGIKVRILKTFCEHSGKEKINKFIFMVEELSSHCGKRQIEM